MSFMPRLTSSLVAALIIVAFSYLASTHATLQEEVSAIKVGDPNDLTISATTLDATTKKEDARHYLTSLKSISLNVQVASRASFPGKLVLFRNGEPIKTQVVANADAVSIQDVTLLENEANIISASFTSTDTANPYQVSSLTVSITCDTIGPRLLHAELVERPVTTGTEKSLIVTFESGDFGLLLTAAQFVVKGETTPGVFSQAVGTGTPEVDGRRVRISFNQELVAGQYQLTVKGTEPNALKDIVGNLAGGNRTAGNDQARVFSALADRTFGEHVEFPPYAPPKQQTIPPEGFNPGDFVETRVARLYYYRDAHRVAEIINRNIRSYNQAAVTQAERRAEDSRDAADDATDERRKAEREAVQAAQEARSAEQKLAAAREALSEVQGLQNTLADDEATAKDLQDELDQLGDPVVGEGPAIATRREEYQTKLKELKARIAKDKANFSRFGGEAAVKAQAQNVVAMEQSVASLRQSELVKQEASTEADAKETRARAKQFRDEVSAAEEDPDTYVAGDVTSVDPVTQVSISVIGEGLIQLRGPIKGINKIRTMINQIDSPVGQIKIGIFTVQVNGEKGDRMEKVVGDAESSIDLSRFLVNQSLNLMRRAIQSEAAMIAEQCEMAGHYQVDRDRRYLYSFFGRDFIDELYAMNSEFLNSENKVLSLHAMDTVSLNRALFILALAKNDVRERIVMRFLESAKTELANAEYDFRRSSELKPHRTQKAFPFWNRTHLPVKNHYEKEALIYEAVQRNALQRYHFRNFSGFFDTGFTNPDTMNPMQREFIRLAQIFKARLVAEMEWKQRVLERGLIEDRSNDEDALYSVLSNVRDKAYLNLQAAYEGMLESTKRLQTASETVDQIRRDLNSIPSSTTISATADYIQNNLQDRVLGSPAGAQREAAYASFYNDGRVQQASAWLSGLRNAKWLTPEQQTRIGSVPLNYRAGEAPSFTRWSEAINILAVQKRKWDSVKDTTFPLFEATILSSDTTLSSLDLAYKELANDLTEQESNANGTALIDTAFGESILAISEQLRQDVSTFLSRKASVDYVKQFLKETRAPLDHRKLLNHMIDEQEEKFIELVEGTRSHIAVMDDYLKRLSIALEDDFKAQFYDPAFVRVRDAARARQVNLGQVERTTILTNNRAFAKVDPQATMEFDLPKRQIAIKEAFDAAKALVEDTGALVNDPTFLAAFQMMGGSMQPTTVKNLLPGQSQSTDQHNMGLVPQQQESGAPGSALQSLVPEPSVYKLETGTGFQIRPVMQPDGDSVVYDFDYMYTTNIREPVRADEKHVGRIKRHYVHTAVQTANFEMREVSRYQVALKVSRTSQGVPLLQDIPILGAAFRPAPSAESSIQQNIILGQTNVYPTLFDLMGLRWAQQVVDLDHASLLESEHVVRGRQKSMRDYVFKVASERVDEFLDIGAKAPDSYRPDFYHSQTRSSPYHPGGYFYPSGVQDPTGNNFERFDRRPPDMQEPPYDRYRHQPVYPELIGPQGVPESIPLNSPRSVPMELGEATGMMEDSTVRLASPTSLSFEPGAATYRNSLRSNGAPVTPTSFERIASPSTSHIRSLPPVR